MNALNDELEDVEMEETEMRQDPFELKDEYSSDDNVDEFIKDPKTGFNYIPDEVAQFLRDATDIVDNLYRDKNAFLRTDHKLNVKDRDNSFLKKIKIALDAIEKLVNKTKSVDYIKTNADYMILLARCYNITDEFYFAKAELLLARACKLKPDDAIVWNLYGEHLWKLNKFGMAINCFKKSDKLDPNNIKNLCDLSMTIRKVALDSPNRTAMNVEAYNYGKRAVNLDRNNGRCWQNMGNAYMSEFFCLGHTPEVVTKAINSYQIAINCEDQKMNPDIYYSAGISCHFNDLYDKSLDYYSMSSSLNPTWDLPQNNTNLMKEYLIKVENEKNSYKGHVKKKYDKELAYLKYPEAMLIKFSRVNLCDLSKGSNNGKVVIGRIMYPWKRDDSVSYHFMLADKTQRVCVNVYNFDSQMFLKCGDTMCVMDPIIYDIDVSALEKPINFRLIRVCSPYSLIVNGNRITRESVSTVTKSQSQLITRNPSVNYETRDKTPEQLLSQDLTPLGVNGAHLSAHDFEYSFGGRRAKAAEFYRDNEKTQDSGKQVANCGSRRIPGRKM